MESFSKVAILRPYQSSTFYAGSMTTRLKALSNWVNDIAELTKPDQIHWCTGTSEEYDIFVQEMLGGGDLLELNQDNYPDCYLHRSDPKDVARVEHLTYVCSENEIDSGPNNNWMPPAKAKEMMMGFFSGCMQGRTMYVLSLIHI